MKISLNTIKQYLDFELPSNEVLVERLNMQLGGVEEVIDLADKYKDVVIVKVLSAEKHPDADRLSVCVIDDGGAVKDVERNADGHVQVVCGAPNVHADMFAAWLPPKATVPASYNDKEPFVLDAREIRGVRSNGMLAAADELALGSDHAGIIEIDPNEWKPLPIEIKPGASFATAYGLDDTIIDIENKMFTHRPDCFGQLGVAREIAGICGYQFTNPEWYSSLPQFADGQGLELTIVNNANEKVTRFMAVALKNVTVKQSPLWLQVELVRLGSKAINNIVDATNYVMLLTGQPTHAYDYDKLRGTMLGVRMANEGETTTLLNGKTYELTADDIVIVDGEGIVGLGGVMGGGNSEVSETTKNIVLEVATFDMYAIRKTSMRHGLFTDAVARFNKGQSPLQNDRVLQLLLRSIQDMSGAEVASPVMDLHALGDVYERQSIAGSVRVDTDFINARLGLSLSKNEVQRLLENVNFSCVDENSTTSVNSTVPFWRTDVELAEDIVEEVGRLYGFDKLARELPQRSIAPAPQNAVFAMKKRVRETLKAAGVHEALTYSFVHENMLRRAGQDPQQAFRLSNALSPDLQHYRLSIVPSLLAHVHANIKAGHDEFALFEFGKAHRVGDVDEDGLPREYPRLGFVYAAKKATTAAYYTARRYVELLTPGLRYEPLSSFDAGQYPIFAQLAAPFDPNRSAVLMDGDRLVGVVGEYSATVRTGFKLPVATAGFELFQSHLLHVQPKAYVPLSRFPAVTQDISLRVPTTTSYEKICTLARQTVTEHQLGECSSTLEPLSIYQSVDNTDHKTISLRLVISSYEKTLTDKEVGRLMDAIATNALKQLNAERV